MQFDPQDLCVVIKGCVKGGAADRDGRIQANDIILAVNGVNARGQSIEEVRGRRGTPSRWKQEEEGDERGLAEDGWQSLLLRGTPEFLDSMGVRTNQTGAEVQEQSGREGDQREGRRGLSASLNDFDLKMRQPSVPADIQSSASSKYAVWELVICECKESENRRLREELSKVRQILDSERCHACNDALKSDGVKQKELPQLPPRV
eukprot:764056-Hanusia_phi.AAC.4